MDFSFTFILPKGRIDSPQPCKLRLLRTTATSQKPSPNTGFAPALPPETWRGTKTNRSAMWSTSAPATRRPARVVIFSSMSRRLAICPKNSGSSLACRRPFATSMAAATSFAARRLGGPLNRLMRASRAMPHSHNSKRLSTGLRRLCLKVYGRLTQRIAASFSSSCPALETMKVFRT